MRVYKLTDGHGRTHGDTLWGEGVTHAVEGKLVMCENGFHAYSDPLLAVLHNPIHGQFDLDTAQLWECAGSDEHLDDRGMNSIHRELTTLRRVDMPRVTREQRVRYGILCALASIREERAKWAREWRAWARGWLSGEDRTAASALAARAAERAAKLAAAAAARAAERAAKLAALAARAATAKPLDLAAIARKAVAV